MVNCVKTQCIGHYDSARLIRNLKTLLRINAVELNHNSPQRIDIFCAYSRRRKTKQAGFVYRFKMVS